VLSNLSPKPHTVGPSKFQSYLLVYIAPKKRQALPSAELSPWHSRPRQDMSLFLQQNIAAATESVGETKVRQFGETKVRQFANIHSIAPVNKNDPRCEAKPCIRKNPQNLHLRAEIKGSFIFQALKIMSPKSKISF
jgi:hypothetical protein